MPAEDPFVTFRAWDRAVHQAFHRLDAAAKKLETSLPSRIPKTLARSVNRLLKFLESHFGIAFLLFFLLASSRAIHWLLNPQFYIEDGREFYLPAFTQGLSSITREYASYYHVVPRILSLLAASLPLRYGPVALELLALGVQASVAAFVVSRRMEKQLPSKLIRFGLAFFVIADPYSNELFANVTHSQWYLGILTLAILFSERGRKSLSVMGDSFVLLLTGLTGPFAPIMAIFSWTRFRQLKSRWIILVVTTLTAVITTHSILQHPRSGIHHSARASLFYRIISNQILYGTLRGFHYTYQIMYEAMFNLREFECALFATAVIIVGLWRAPAFLRALGWLGLYCFLTSLDSRASWALLGSPGVGERYYFYLDIVFAYGLFALSKRAPSALVRWCFRGMLLVMSVAILQEWVYDPPYPKFDYVPQIAGYEKLHPGEAIDVMTPIDRKSPKEFWTITIPKKD